MRLSDDKKMTRSEAIAFLRAHGKILPAHTIMYLSVRMAVLEMAGLINHG